MEREPLFPHTPPPPEPPPVATERELDARALVEADRFLTLDVIYREIGANGELGRVVSTGEYRFPVRGRIPIPTMTAFYRLETRINNSLQAADDDRAAMGDLEAAMEEAHEKIVAIVAEKSPDVFAPHELPDRKRIQGRIELELNQILGILAWLSGDTSIADALAKALTAGQTGALTEEAARERTAEGPDAAPDAAVPLPSSAR